MLGVCVHAKAKKNRLEVVDGTRLKAWVTAAPEGDKANDALVVMLARRLRVSKTSITIVRGRTQREKILRVDNLTVEKVLEEVSNRYHLSSSPSST